MVTSNKINLKKVSQYYLHSLRLCEKRSKLLGAHEILALRKFLDVHSREKEIHLPWLGLVRETLLPY